MDGESLLLLPGMMLDHRMWTSQHAALEAVADVTVGHYDGHETISGAAASSLSIMDEKFGIVGFSLGAIIALEIWRQAPNRITSMVLIGINPRADVPERWPRRQAQMDRAECGELLELMSEDFLPNYFASAASERLDLTAEILQMASDMGPIAFRNQSLAQAGREDKTPYLSAIAQPVLLLCGNEDRITSAEDHVRTADLIPGAKITRIPDAGHLVTMEQPDAVNEALLAFYGAH